MADKKPAEASKDKRKGRDKVPIQNEEEKRVPTDNAGAIESNNPNESNQPNQDTNGLFGVDIGAIIPKPPKIPDIRRRTWGKWAPESEKPPTPVEKPKPKGLLPPTVAVASPPPPPDPEPEKVTPEPEPKEEKRKRKEKAHKEKEPKKKRKHKELPPPEPEELQQEPVITPPPPTPKPEKIQPEPVQKPKPKETTPPPKPEPAEVKQDPVEKPKELPPPPKPVEISKEPGQKEVPKELPPQTESKPVEEHKHRPSRPSRPKLVVDYDLPYNLDVASLVPSHMVKSVKIKRAKKIEAIRMHVAPPTDDDKPPGPVASKVVFLKRPDEPNEKAPGEPVADSEPAPEVPKGVIQPEGAVDIDGLPMFLVTDTVANLIHITDTDKLIDKRLSELIDVHRGDILKKLKKKKQNKIPTYTYAEMMKMLKEQGIPCPTNDDFSRLHGLHSRWDPDFTVLEYFSPMLRTFVPINMRGRYRGCWTTDDCIKGLDISKVPPKREALEGFVQRGRHENTQKKFDVMSKVALDEAHLDYLIEIQSYQAETLPIPIFYDMLHLGMEVANENLRILAEEDGYPPNDIIFMSTEEHAQQLKRKIQLYGALGLETLESRRKGLGEYMPQWLQTRDEVVREIMKRKDTEWYSRLSQMEEEGKARERMRKGQENKHEDKHEEPKPKSGTSFKTRASLLLNEGRTNKVNPETPQGVPKSVGDGGRKGALKTKK